MQKLNFNINGKHYEATITEVEHNVAEVELNGKKYTIDVERSEAVASAPRVVAPKAAPAPKAEVPAGGKKVTSPLPGSVIKVLVSEGQAVKKGDTLLTLESMKMENAIMAECDATVTKVVVSAGQTVMQEDLLVVLG